ncbi:hypothetical protein ETD83_20895 [Actinomadura soli]|uniref:Uncharacterized protein n=1 Tax=Actinomadura soli TaxID=2508997 RepID=A0A5C4J913_9ACTN|nr:hypothetical protein [Actinomadura soli]TMQ96814.1 hypothetical protein ETD83_20895 [Actinomadura soli]
MSAVVQAPELWRVLAVAACLVSAAAGGVAVGAWVALTLAPAVPAARLTSAFIAELRARAQQRLRAVAVALAAAVALVVTALITGLFA